MHGKKRWAAEVRWAIGPHAAGAGLGAASAATAVATAVGALPTPTYLVASIGALLALLLVQPRPVHLTRRKVRVRVADGAITFGDQTVRADQVTHAAVLPRRDHTELRLDRGGTPPLRLAFRKTTTALRVLAELGVDPSRTVERQLLAWSSVEPMAARVLRPVVLATTTLGLTWLLAAAGAEPWVFRTLVGLVALVGVSLFVLRGPRLTLAEDGLEVRTLFARRFVPFAAITGVELDDRFEQRWLVVRTATGAPLEISDVDVGAIAARLRARLALEGAHGETPPELARANRPPSAWIEGLRAAATVPTFRAPSLPTPELRRVALDPQAPLEARAAATVALAAQPAERAVLARVAEGTASPALRAVVEAAHDGDDEALVAALGALPLEEDPLPQARLR